MIAPSTEKGTSSMRSLVLAVPVLLLMACNNPRGSASSDVPDPDFVLSNEQTHDKFSRSIPPATGFGTTVDEAARKATQYMVGHVSRTYGLSWEESYMLCSLIGDLKIAEVVDLPHMLVTMHIPKAVFERRPRVP